MVAFRGTGPWKLLSSISRPNIEVPTQNVFIRGRGIRGTQLFCDLSHLCFSAEISLCASLRSGSVSGSPEEATACYSQVGGTSTERMMQYSFYRNGLTPAAELGNGGIVGCLQGTNQLIWGGGYHRGVPSAMVVFKTDCLGTV